VDEAGREHHQKPNMSQDFIRPIFSNRTEPIFTNLGLIA
jgi:hypothetical protein